MNGNEGYNPVACVKEKPLGRFSHPSCKTQARGSIVVNPSQQQTPSSISPAATDADWFLVTSFVFGAFKTYLVNDVIV